MTSYVILVTVSHLKMLWGEVGKRNKLLVRKHTLSNSWPKGIFPTDGFKNLRNKISILVQTLVQVFNKKDITTVKFVAIVTRLPTSLS